MALASRREFDTSECTVDCKRESRNVNLRKIYIGYMFSGASGNFATVNDW